MQSIASYIKTLPYFYRDIQPSFISSLEAHKGFMESKGCEAPNYVLGYWYISPEQHVAEFFIVLSVFIPLVMYLMRAPLRPDVPCIPRVLDSSAVWSNRDPEKHTKDAVYASGRARVGGVLRVLDWVFTAGMWVTGVMTVYFKLQGDCAGRPKLAYIVQPCHLSNFILCALSLLHTTPTSSALFEFYLNFSYGALLALATPDTRGLDNLPMFPGGDTTYTWEKASFFAQHALLVLLPTLWILRRRFSLTAPPTVDARALLLAWALSCILHWGLFLPLSLATGHNVNYMLVPPGGPLWLVPKTAFRAVMGLACIAFAVITRMAFELVVQVSGIRLEAAREAKLLEKLSGGGSGPNPSPSARSSEPKASPRGASEGAGALPSKPMSSAERSGSKARRSPSPAPAAAAAAAEVAAASAQATATASGSGTKYRKDTGLQGSYWTALSPRQHMQTDTVSSAAKKRGSSVGR